MASFMAKNKLLADLCLLLTAIIWGSGFIAVRIATDAGMSAELILFSRFTVSAVLVAAIFRKKVFLCNKSELLYGIITGIFLFFPFYAQTIGIRYTSNSNNAFLTSVCVIIVPVLEWAVFRKRPKNRVLLCAVMAMAGIGILTGINGAFSLNMGDWLTLLGSILFSCHIICLGISAKKVDTEKLLFLQMATCCILSLASCLISYSRQFALSINWSTASLAVVYLGIFSTTLAFFIQTAAQKAASPSAVTIILSTEALFATIFSVALGFEGVTLNLAAGGALMIFAVILLDIRIKPKTKSEAT